MPLKKLRTKLKTDGLDAMLISQPHNRRYLSGFTGSAGVLLITPTEQLLLTDSRYYEQVRREAPAWTLEQAGYNIAEHLAKLIPDLNLNHAKIGFEAGHITVAEFERWQKTLSGVQLVPTTNLVMALRAVKTGRELAAIRRAVALTDNALAHICNIVAPGQTEKEVAWELETYMRTHGASAMAFDIIVAAGANAALPHATPSDYTIEPGDVMLIDMGCVVDGYCSDLTRTFSLGTPNHPRYLEIWQVVKRAAAAAAAGIKAGISSKTADALARDIIEQAGWGDNFGHSLGHGVGLAVHEAPKVSYAAEDPLPAGAVITVEPGVYLPGEFGVRLEDMAVVTSSGVEMLTAAPKTAVLAR